MDIVQTKVEFVEGQVTDMPKIFQPSDETPPGDGIVFLVPVGFMVLWSIAAIFFLGLPKVVGQQESRLHYRLHQLPCYRCRFFSHNPYLKCPVRPTTVMTKDALDCSDYAPQAEQHSPHQKP